MYDVLSRFTRAELARANCGKRKLNVRDRRDLLTSFVHDFYFMGNSDRIVMLRVSFRSGPRIMKV